MVDLATPSPPPPRTTAPSRESPLAPRSSSDGPPQIAVPHRPPPSAVPDRPPLSAVPSPRPPPAAREESSAEASRRAREEAEETARAAEILARRLRRAEAKEREAEAAVAAVRSRVAALERAYGYEDVDARVGEPNRADDVSSSSLFSRFPWRFSAGGSTDANAVGFDPAPPSFLSKLLSTDGDFERAKPRTAAETAIASMRDRGDPRELNRSKPHCPLCARRLPSHLAFHRRQHDLGAKHRANLAAVALEVARRAGLVRGDDWTVDRRRLERVENEIVRLVAAGKDPWACADALARSVGDRGGSGAAA